MGCVSSKHVEPMDVYRPTGASLALFNLGSIEEPWLKQQQQQHLQPKSGKGIEVPKPLLEKLNTFELAPDAPHSWSEVSKALEDLKPTLDQKPKTQPGPETEKQSDESPAEEKKQPISKKQSFHTLEELDAKLKQKPEPKPPQPTSQNAVSSLAKPILDSTQSGKLKDNYFIVLDRLQRNKDDNSTPRFPRRKRDPLEGLPEKCPPAGADKVVLYTTTLRGVRRTFEDCKRAKSVMEGYRVTVDERDVSLHLDYLTELRELLGEEVFVPRLFIKGRYVGGVEEMVDLNERGKLGEMLDTVGPKGENSGEACEACGDLRFIPCLDCSGSCKVLDEKEVFVRCTRCNENGLIMCPVCH
ncbi:Uncharacterized protein EJ110_NYTH17516 [Nymphaea thermarum]|nr:Uncharacterized protein EJ110_NYTH17516 [Nymphaea thermarum]